VIGDVIRTDYGFDSFFFESGERGAHEKGGVEGEVGRFRRRHRSGRSAIALSVAGPVRRSLAPQKRRSLLTSSPLAPASSAAA